MAKIVGFNEAIAIDQADKKRANQRKLSLKQAGARIRFVKDSRVLTHKMVI